MINTDFLEGGGKSSSWSGKIYLHIHLSKPLFSPLSCLGSCWIEISLQFSLETTLMSRTDLAHQYFTSKPNLLRMTTYHRQDMSFTAATFTFSVFPIYAHSHTVHTDCCACFFFFSHYISSTTYKHPYHTLEIFTHTTPGTGFSDNNETVAQGKLFACMCLTCKHRRNFKHPPNF